VAKQDTDRLRQRLADTAIDAMITHVPGWIDTLGASGKMSNKKVSPAVRVSAAKTGIDLVTKFIGSGSSTGGEDLLSRLAQLNDAPIAVEPEEDEQEGASDEVLAEDQFEGDPLMPLMGDRPTEPEL
jgi:hypothetical protein